MNFSWRISALYKFTPDINGYVTVARGYKPVLRPQLERRVRRRGRLTGASMDD